MVNPNMVNGRKSPSGIVIDDELRTSYQSSMKKLMMSAFLCVIAASAYAQDVNARHGIGRVEGDGASAPYFARTPYTLYWNADPKYKLYGKSDPSVKAETYIAGIHVKDVDTGKIVASLDHIPLSGSMKVPVAGRHTIELFSTGPWQASYVEDEAALTAAARHGELAQGKTLEQSANTGHSARMSSVAEALAGTLKDLEGKAKGSDLDARIAGARLIASRSSSVEDYEKRWADYKMVQGW